MSSNMFGYTAPNAAEYPPSTRALPPIVPGSMSPPTVTPKPLPETAPAATAATIAS